MIESKWRTFVICWFFIENSNFFILFCDRRRQHLIYLLWIEIFTHHWSLARCRPSRRAPRNGIDNKRTMWRFDRNLLIAIANIRFSFTFEHTTSVNSNRTTNGSKQQWNNERKNSTNNSCRFVRLSLLAIKCDVRMISCHPVFCATVSQVYAATEWRDRVIRILIEQSTLTNQSDNFCQNVVECGREGEIFVFLQSSRNVMRLQSE